MHRVRTVITALFVTLTALLPSSAQNKGQPGKFDFYLLDMPWGPEFCSIVGVSPQCKPQQSFVLHGLWPQNNDGSYPVFCSDEPGPAHPRENLDITPDIALLAHEWAKHGTCSDQGPRRYFQMARNAFTSVHMPLVFDKIDHETTMSPAQILAAFYKINPQLPQGSLIVSCRDDHFTAVEACFTTSMKPMRCLGLHSCTAPVLKIAPVPVSAKRN